MPHRLAPVGLSCNSITSVDAPDILQPSQLNTPEGANVLRVGAMSRFYYTVIFYPFGVPGTAGVLSDELVSGGSGGTQGAFDARRLAGDAELPHFVLHPVRPRFEDALPLFKKLPHL